MESSGSEGETNENGFTVPAGCNRLGGVVCVVCCCCCCDDDDAVVGNEEEDVDGEDSREEMAEDGPEATTEV